jgi:hypothetical protein
MKIVAAVIISLLKAIGKLLAKPINFALRVHILIFAFLFTVFTIAGAYEFLVLLRYLVQR